MTGKLDLPLFDGITTNTPGKNLNISLISQPVIFSFNISTLWKILFLPSSFHEALQYKNCSGMFYNERISYEGDLSYI